VGVFVVFSGEQQAAMHHSVGWVLNGSPSGLLLVGGLWTMLAVI